MQSLKKCLLVLVSTIVCFNALINDGECLRNKRNLQNQIVSTEKQKLSRQNISNKKEKQQQQVVNNLPTLADDLNSKYVESDIQDNYNNVMDKQTETPVQQFNNKYNKVDASTQYEDPTYQETIETTEVSCNQQGSVPPPPPPAPHSVPNILTIKGNNSGENGMSLEEELANARSRLKKVVKNDNESNNNQIKNETWLEKILKQQIQLRKRNLNAEENEDDKDDDDWDNNDKIINNKIANYDIVNDKIVKYQDLGNKENHKVRDKMRSESVNNESKEISFEEELANARSRLKPIGSNNNGNLSNDKIEDNKNFLQNVLSEAIKLRYKNLHMHDDDQDDEGDDDW